MKHKFFSGCLALLLAGVGLCRASEDFYVNDAVVNCPPQIPPQVDATNFVNNNYFGINFTNLIVNNTPVYDTANTLNFTNTGLMIGNYAFQFETKPTGTGQRRMASSFFNSGTISCGSIANTNTFFNFFFNLFAQQQLLPKLMISATNVAISGTNIVGLDGLFTLTGKKVDLNRGTIAMEGFNDSAFSTTNFFFFFNNLFGTFGSAGIFSSYWSVGTNIMFPASQFETSPPSSPGAFGLVLPGAISYVNDVTFGTNRFVQAVFLRNTNSFISNNIYFPNTGQIVVEWLARETNLATGSFFTNYLYLFDDFGSGFTNTLVQSFPATAPPSFIPINYTFVRGGPYPFLFTPPATPGLPPGTFNNTQTTNQYAAYGALFAPTTVIPGLTPGSVITNMPGRIEIIADNELNLARAKITGLNYTRLRSTNHFAGSSRAQIITPYSDIALGTTNGMLAITNLLSPTVPRFEGEVDLWSGRWTNVDPVLTTRYQVLFVDSLLSPTAPARIQDLNLRSTNLVISDVLNVTRSLMLETERLTVTTNEAPTATPSGEINLLSSLITWPTSTPRLQYLTNSGSIHSLNTVFFGGSRFSPFYTSNYNEPYMAFVNHGTVTTEGSLIWANYFENTGLFTTGLGLGSITLQSQIAYLTNGTFLALGGDISITSGDLIATNHSLQAGRSLSLAVTNLLTDTSVSNVNTWTVGKGVNLLAKPATGDLLGTTIFGTVTPGAEAINRWAAEDRGCTTAGFTNDAAIGRLILDGGDDSQFTFTGTGTNNAIYIDYLELRNFMTNRDGAGDFIGIQIDPNMKIYFAQAIANGVSIAEKLDGQNGGRFCWVSDYAGYYSGTNVVYPDGTTNFFNAALVASCNLDSDGDGLVNCSDTTPILRPQDLALSVSLMSTPAMKANVSWQSGPYAANFVYYKTSPNSTNWLLLTNFVSGAVGGRVSVSDPVNATSPRYYRVRVDAHQP